MSDEEYRAAYKGKQKPILINALDRSVSVQGVTENKISEAIKNTFIDASFDPSRYIIEYTNLYIHPHHSDPAARPKPGDGKNTFFLTDKSPNTDAAIPFIDLSPFFGENSSVVTKFVSEGNIQITINIREGTYIIDGELDINGVFYGTINGITAPTDLFLGNQVKNTYINNNGSDSNYQLKCVCYAICKEIGDLYQVLYIKAIIDYNNLLNNVDKILGHGEQPITADNSLILTPDKPVSARSKIRAIPVLLRYCNASLGIISSIFFPAGDPEKMKEAIIKTFITEIINHNNKQINFLKYFKKKIIGSITIKDRKIGTFTCKYWNIHDDVVDFAKVCIEKIETCNIYLDTLKLDLNNLYIDNTINKNSAIHIIRGYITNFKAYSLFKGIPNLLEIDAGMQSKITYYKLKDDKDRYDYKMTSPFSATLLGIFRKSRDWRSVEESGRKGGDGRGKRKQDEREEIESRFYSTVNTIFDATGYAIVDNQIDLIVDIINALYDEYTQIHDIAIGLINNSIIDITNSDDPVTYDDITNSDPVRYNNKDVDFSYSNKLNDTLMILESGGLKYYIDNLDGSLQSSSSSIGPPPGGPPTSPTSSGQQFSGIFGTPPVIEPGPNGPNISPPQQFNTSQLVRYPSLPYDPQDPTVEPRISRSSSNVTSGNESMTGSSSFFPPPVKPLAGPSLIRGGKKSRKKNTKRSVNRVRKTKLRKTKKVNKTKLRKTKKNKK